MNFGEGLQSRVVSWYSIRYSFCIRVFIKGMN
jgi:hypothetical protein